MQLTTDQLRTIAQQVKDQGGTIEHFNAIVDQIESEGAPTTETSTETTPPVGFTEEDLTVPTITKKTGEQVAPTKTEGQSISDMGVSFGESITKTGESLKPFERTPGEGFFSSAGKFLGNIPGGAVSLTGEAVSAVSQPIETVKGGVQAADSLVQLGLNKIFNTPTGKDILRGLGVKEAGIKKLEAGNYSDEKTKAVAEQIGSKLEENFGTIDKAATTIVSNPEDVLSIFLPAKSVGKVTGVTKDVKKIEKLTKQAEQQVGEFLKPTKETTKTIAKEITPEILKKGIKGSREDVMAMSEAKLKDIGAEMDKYISAGKLQGDIEISKLVDTLAKADKELRFEGQILPGREAQVAYINKQLDFLGELENKFGNKLGAEQQRVLRQSFDKVFDKGVTRDKITKFQDDLDLQLADTLRAELAKNNPDFDKLNKDYHFYSGLRTVLDETLDRTTGQANVGLLQTIGQGQKGTIGFTLGAGAGGTLGGAVGGAGGAAVGATIGGTIGGSLGVKLEAIMSSPQWKLASAQKKAELANALATGKLSTAEKILDSMIISAGLGNMGFTSGKPQEDRKPRK